MADKQIRIKLFSIRAADQVKAHHLPKELEDWLIKLIDNTEKELEYSSKKIKSWELVINTCQKNSKPKSE